jgi:hypothetical protein
LTRFVDDAHSTATDAFEDFELRECGSDVVDRRRWLARDFLRWFGRLHGASHEAARAESAGRRGLENGAAGVAQKGIGIHVTGFLPRPRRMVTSFFRQSRTGTRKKDASLDLSAVVRA